MRGRDVAFVDLRYNLRGSARADCGLGVMKGIGALFYVSKRFPKTKKETLAMHRASLSKIRSAAWRVRQALSNLQRNTSC